MFTVEVSRTTCWEEANWEATEEKFNTFQEAEVWGESWQERQETVESFDGFHNAAKFRVVEVN